MDIGDIISYDIFVPAIYFDAMWIVRLTIVVYVVHNYFNAHVLITKLLLSRNYDQLLLERVSKLGKVSFSQCFFSSPCSVELKVVLSRLRHQLITYVTVPGLALVTAPSLSSLSIIRTTISAV